MRTHQRQTWDILVQLQKAFKHCILIYTNLNRVSVVDKSTWMRCCFINDGFNSGELNGYAATTRGRLQKINVKKPASKTNTALGISDVVPSDVPIKHLIRFNPFLPTRIRFCFNFYCGSLSHSVTDSLSLSQVTK